MEKNKIPKNKKIECVDKYIHKFKPLMRKIDFPKISDLEIPKIKIGIELECVYNTDYLEIDIGDYHRAISFTDNWRAERDGSLYGRNHFDRGRCVEFTTEIIDIDDYKSVLEELKNSFDNEDLNKVLVFNDSCGCHIHFSSPKKKYSKNIPSCVYPLTRKFFFNELENSLIIPQPTKEIIKKHYFRHYAQKYNKTHIECRNRYTEFNFYSERQGMGLEWRSFNVRGVNTWEELEEMFRIGTDTIKYISSVLYNFIYEEKSNIKEKDLKGSINENKIIKIDNMLEYNNRKVIIKGNPIKDKVFYQTDIKKLNSSGGW